MKTKQIMRAIIVCMIAGSIISLSASFGFAQEKKSFFERMMDRVRGKQSMSEEEVVDKKAPASTKPKEKKSVFSGRKKRDDKDVAEGGRRTKEEMLTAIKARLESYPEILDYGVGIVKDGSEIGGYDYYAENSRKAVVRIDDLTPNELFPYYVRVNNMAAKLNMDRLNNILNQQEQLRHLQNMQRQQETIRQIQSIQRSQNIPVQPQPVPTAGPTLPPQTPKVPPQPPRVPRR
jgi:5-bromo-4-chloroindolyl phosphate hydrolysis protein